MKTDNTDQVKLIDKLKMRIQLKNTKYVKI